MQPTVGTPEQGMILKESIGELMISLAASGCMGNGNRRNHDRGEPPHLVVDHLTETHLHRLKRSPGGTPVGGRIQGLNTVFITQRHFSKQPRQGHVCFMHVQIIFYIVGSRRWRDSTSRRSILLLNVQVSSLFLWWHHSAASG